MEHSYPGYEIERFEDEGGNQCVYFRYIEPPQSLSESTEDADAREKEIQEHQE